MKKEYYKAYDKRYKAYHDQENQAWAGDRPSYVLKDIINKYIKNNMDSKILEIGCGEGQNAIYLLQNGYNIEASDVSREAIKWCKKEAKKHDIKEGHFFVLDVLNNKLTKKYDLIYSISTLHMLVRDEDRKKFLDFVHDHLNDSGTAIITIMGDGIKEQNNSDITKSFDDAERIINGKKVTVATTSCRIVNWETFFNELRNSNLSVLNHYINNEISGFNSSMIVELKRK